jgi:hypothetical protein
MKNILILMMAIVVLSSCSKDNDDDATNQIVGKWKLVKIEYYKRDANTNGSLQTTDYSVKNIIYDFRLNNKLIISGEDNMDSENRVSDYVFEKDYLSGFPSEGESKMFLVKIDGSKWNYSLTNGIMKLGQSYIDGSDLYFEKEIK